MLSIQIIPLLFRLLFFLISTPIMTLFRRISQRLDLSSDSRKPYNTDGARPQSSHSEKDMKDFFTKLTPVIPISDWVSTRRAYMRIFLRFLEGCHTGRGQEYGRGGAGRQEDVGMCCPPTMCIHFTETNICSSRMRSKLCQNTNMNRGL